MKILFTIFLFFSLGAVSFINAENPNNRFLISKNFRVHYGDWPNSQFNHVHDNTAIVTISFHLQNVSNGGISLFFTKKQFNNFSVDNYQVADCNSLKSAAVPIIKRFVEEEARREAVYIPKSDSLFVSVKLRCTLNKKDKRRNGVLKNGIISSRISVIKGKRILTRPISGSF